MTKTLICQNFFNPARIKVADDTLLNDLGETLRSLSSLEEDLALFFEKDLPQYQYWLAKNFSDALACIAAADFECSRMSGDINESIELSFGEGRNPAEIFQQLCRSGRTEEKTNSAEPRIFKAQSKCPSRTSSAPNSVKKIYRRIACLLHPDRSKLKFELEAKNLWMRAQKAYADLDEFELLRLEQILTGLSDSYFNLGPLEKARFVEQIKDRFNQKQGEHAVMRRENAWGFSRGKDLRRLKAEIKAELSLQLSRLQKKIIHLGKTAKAWETPVEKVKVTKPMKKVARAQVSLFDR